MEQDTTLWHNPIIKRATIALVLLLAIFLSYSIYLQVVFRIVAMTPRPTDMTILSPYMKIDFNKQLANEGVSVSGSDNLIQSYSVSAKTLTVLFNYPLILKKSYTLTINSVSSTSGKTIQSKSFSFVPKFADALHLTTEQQKALVSVQDKNQGPSVDPIVTHLPYGTLDFNLTAAVTADAQHTSHLVLHAKLLLSRADLSNQAAAVAQYKQEVIDYIKVLGFDPAKYTIEYSVATSN